MKYVQKEILGSQMLLLPDDRGLSRQLIKNGIREKKTTAYTRNILKPDWVAIDIGANLGYYALLEAKMCFKGFVYAVEPVKITFKTLNKNIKLNGYKNIKTFNIALSNQSGVSKIAVSNRLNGSNMFIYSDIVTDEFKERFGKRLQREEKVNTTTLDNFVRENNIDRINFLRMDVEGHEFKIMEKADYALSKMVSGSYLSIEFHAGINRDKEQVVETVEKILSSGFDIASTNWAGFKKTKDSLMYLLFKTDKCPQVFFRRV